MIEALNFSAVVGLIIINGKLISRFRYPTPDTKRWYAIIP
jgi:hypothetical protein